MPRIANFRSSLRIVHTCSLENVVLWSTAIYNVPITVDRVNLFQSTASGMKIYSAHNSDWFCRRAKRHFLSFTYLGNSSMGKRVSWLKCRPAVVRWRPVPIIFWLLLKSAKSMHAVPSRLWSQKFGRIHIRKFSLFDLQSIIFIPLFTSISSQTCYVIYKNCKLWANRLGNQDYYDYHVRESNLFNGL